MRRLTHTEIENLLGAHALDAVAPPEREVVESHVPGCASCRSELADHHEVAALLVDPFCSVPTGIWGRIADALEESPPPLALAPVVPLTRRRVIVRRMAAAAAVVVAVGVGVGLVAQERRFDQVETAMSDDMPRRAALLALGDPDATLVDLRGAGSAAARAAVLPDGQGYLVVDALPALPPDQTYQLWALVEGDRISGGTLGADPDVVAFHVAGTVAGFAVTAERAGGVSASANPPVLIGWTG